MSVSSVGTGATASASQYQQQRGQSQGGYFRQLIQAIKSGNLDAAQSAYDSLTSQLPASDQSSTNASTGTTASDSGGNSSFQQFLQQVGAALQSGDIQGAQTALSSLEQNSKVGGGHHHHHGGGGGAVQASTSTSADTTGTGSSASSAASGLNLTV